MEDKLIKTITYNPNTGTLMNNKSKVVCTRLDRYGYLEVRYRLGNKTKYLIGHRVCWFLHYGKWRARIKVNGVAICLGTYNTELDAHLAYTKYRTENGL